ncbi:SDR family oxidoreductase [Streptomyces fulvoviolaceus]|uniref:SDR family oxidoreductase n=1 Tax=Streptomyces fulvoviolaceus TaxID=285535 RepID=UPI0004CC8A12|nr:SDR family oxidoreductase [Streptomyces fulvoviolaceus]MCT9081738.1 SDR family oxidoreductase [Streptomyces fulvoviolaceus]
MSDYLQYAGKTAVVTGAASGIGKATAQRLVELGAEVHVIDYAPAELPGLASATRANLGVREEIDQAFASLPEHIDAFFGVAGVSGLQHDYNTTLLINFGSYKYISKTYLEARMSEGGAIAYVSSLGGINWERYQEELEGLIQAEGWDAIVKAIEGIGNEDQPGPVAYALSKRLLNLFVAHSAIELAGRGIRVNTLLPTNTETGLTADFAVMRGGRDQLEANSGLNNRLAVPEEMADPLVFLNSHAARYISGQPLLVDFGARNLQLLGRKEDMLDRPLIGEPKAAGS